MLAWLNENIVFWHWMVLGLALISLEILVPTFFLLWFGVSALVVGGLMLVLPLSITWQLVVWSVLSLLVIYLWFRVIAPRFTTKSLSGMGKETMLNQVGTMIDYNPGTGRGRVRFPAPILGDDEWHCICSDATLQIGHKVVVRDFSGNALLVEKFGH